MFSFNYAKVNRLPEKMLAQAIAQTKSTSQEKGANNQRLKPPRNQHQTTQRRSAELTIVPADRLTPPGDSELEAVAGGFSFW